MSIVRRLREAAKQFLAMEIQLVALERERVAASLSCIGRTGTDYDREDDRHQLAISAIRAISGFGGAESTLVTECGKRLIEAHARGLVPPQHRELAELIAYHRQPLRPPPEGFKVARVPPHPANLFDDVCGGNWAKIVPDADGRLRSGAEYGGLMPRWDESHLKLTKFERYAATCEFLADLIEASACQEPLHAWMGPRDPYRFLYPGKDRDFSDAPLQFKLIQHLWDEGGFFPMRTREIQMVLDELYPGDDEADSTLVSLVKAVNTKFTRASIPLMVRRTQGDLWLDARPGTRIPR